MSDLVRDVIQVVVLISIIAGVFGLAVSIGVASERRGGGGWRGLGNTETRRALAVTILVLAYVAALPFVVPLVGGVPQEMVRYSPLVMVPVGAYFAARQLRPGWAVLGSVSVLVGSVWLFTMSTLKAYQWGWQGLDVRDIRSDDISEEFGMAAAAVIGTALVLLPGVIIGMLASRGSGTRGEGSAPV